MAKDARGRELPKGIRQRDNGTFEGRVAVDGKRVSVYGNTVTEVKKKIAETKYKMEHGIYVDQCNISFDEWFNTWLEEYKKNSVKSGTVFSYKNYYKYYIKDELGMRKLRIFRTISNLISSRNGVLVIFSAYSRKYSARASNRSLAKVQFRNSP